MCIELINARSIAGLVERLGHCVYEDSYRDGLKPAQWAALRYFASANRFSRTTSAFAKYQGVSRGAASQTISALVLKELLVRETDANDRRRQQVSLSARAWRLIENDPISALVTAIGALSNGEQLSLTSGLQQILSRLVEQRNGTYFGYCRDCEFLQCQRRTGGRASLYRCSNLDQSLNTKDLTEHCVNYVQHAT